MNVKNIIGWVCNIVAWMIATSLIPGYQFWSPTTGWLCLAFFFSSCGYDLREAAKDNKRPWENKS